MTKAQSVQFLTTNCECWKGNEATLNTMDEKLLEKLVQQEQKRIMTSNILTKGFVIGERKLTFNSDGTQLTVNAKTAADAELPEVDLEDEEDEDEGEETKKPKKKDEPAMNAAEFLKSAPTEIRRAVANAMANEERERNEVINKLTANMDKAAKERFVKKFGELDIADLQVMLPLATNRATVAEDPMDAISMRLGAVPFRQEQMAANEAEEDVLLPPTMEYEPLPSAHKKR